jgi:hypothetical protein
MIGQVLSPTTSCRKTHHFDDDQGEGLSKAKKERQMSFSKNDLMPDRSPKTKSRAVAVQQATPTTLYAKELHLYFQVINSAFRDFENETGEGSPDASDKH